MGARLNTFVHAVELDEQGQPTGRSETFGPNVDVPEWAINAITNGDVWVGAPPKRSTSSPASGTTDEASPVQAQIAELEKNHAGVVAQMQARIAELQAERDDQVQAEVKPETGYEGRTLPELRAELASRDLATSGNKPELIARLQQHDEARKAQAPAETPASPIE